MTIRSNYAKAAPGVYDAMDALDRYLTTGSVDERMLHLVRLRASQIKHCAYCIDMHWKDLRALGETEQRLYGLDAWRESPYYSRRERAALAWTEAVTLITDGQVPPAPVLEETEFGTSRTGQAWRAKTRLAIITVFSCFESRPCDVRPH